MNMALNISKWSITRKLTAVLMLTSAITLTLAVTGFLLYEFFNYRQVISNQLQTMGDIMEENLATTMSFERPDETKEALADLRRRSDIICAAVYENSGTLYVDYIPPGQKKFIPPDNLVAGVNFYGNTCQLIQIIKGEPKGEAGKLYIRVGLSNISKRVEEYSLIVGVLGLLTLGVAFALSIQLQKFISQPILRVAEVARQVSINKDYSLRVNRESEDELGSLIQAFNEMLREIFNRDRELQAANLKLASYSISLEREVESRTAALLNKSKEAEHQQFLAERANRAKSEFLTQMSHELRTPLNGILGYAQILKNEKNLSTSQHDGVCVIERSGEHLLNLINDILDLSKIESRKLELLRDEFSLRNLISDIGVMFRIRAEAKGLTFAVEGAEALPFTVNGDQKRLSQVLLNLLGNAVKFTEEGHIILRAARNGENIRFEIIDTGVGISKEKIDEIFLPFHQVGDSRRFIEGTGLGLAISHRLVGLMGGQLETISELGKGSKFYFEIPLPEVESKRLTKPISKRRLIGYQGGRRQIMIVDDLKENRGVVKDMLQPLGFEVLEKESGTACIESVQEKLPDLVIMDLMMPGMNGYEAIRRIRLLTQELPVIASSASVFLENQKMSFLAGCHDFLSKPVRYEELIRVITTHIHLEWCYEIDDTPEVVIANKVPKGGIPSDRDCQQILALVQRGDVRRIYEQVERLEKENPLFVPFTNHLRQLLGKFEINKIDSYIEQLLKER